MLADSERRPGAANGLLSVLLIAVSMLAPSTFPWPERAARGRHRCNQADGRALAHLGFDAQAKLDLPGAVARARSRRTNSGQRVAARRPPTPHRHRPDPQRGTAARKRAARRGSRSRRDRSPSQHQYRSSRTSPLPAWSWPLTPVFRTKLLAAPVSRCPSVDRARGEARARGLPCRCRLDQCVGACPAVACDSENAPCPPVGEPRAAGGRHFEWAGAALATVTLIALALNTTVGWWWADSVAALLISSALLREGALTIQAARRV